MKYDLQGSCVFHSSDLEWKEDLFWEYFSILLSWLIKENKINEEETALLGVEFHFIGTKEEWQFFSNLDLSFSLDFRGATFHTGIHINNSKLSFINTSNTIFKSSSKIENCIFKSFYATSCHFKEVAFQKNIFNNIVLFNDSHIYGLCEFTENVFNNYLKFKGVKFRSEIEGCKFLFSENKTEGILDFTDTDFGMDVLMEDCTFNGEVNFIDTNFRKNKQVEFIDFKINNQFNFRASDNHPKIFNESVTFDINGKNITGMINFRNINFINIIANHRNILKDLVKEGKVNIGSGCIKYRLQSPPKKIKISEHNQVLISELSNTFAHFVKYDEDINLGFEIAEKNQEEISFFYYSDMDISYEEFIQRLFKSESKMWSLLKVEDSTIEVDNETTMSMPEKQLKRIDAMIALGAFMLKLSNRILMNKISAEEFSSLMNGTPNSLSNVSYKDVKQITIKQYSFLGFKISQSINLK